MITWRDSLGLCRKRLKRKRVFGSLKYSAPLFLLTLLTIVTLNILYVLGARVSEAARDSHFPHPSHLRVTTPPKSKDTITSSQLKALRGHPAVRHFMGQQQWLTNVFPDMGEARYAMIPFFCGYSHEFFNLYRTLAKDKVDPSCVPVLLGRDLLSLSWSPVQQRFVRNEGEEMTRWLGKTFSVYLNPLGTEGFNSTFTLEQLDYPRYRQSVIMKRKLLLAELERVNPDLARQQDALFIRMQVVGFVRDLSENGLVSVLPEDVAARIAELSALRRGKKLKPLTDEGLSSVSLLVSPERKAEIVSLANSIGLKVHEKNGEGVVSKLYESLRADPATMLVLYVISALYTFAMMIIIYQLLSCQVKDSIREIGLLRCIGARRRDIMRIFIVMNLVRLARIYISCLVASYLILLAAGHWSAGWLNLIDPEDLVKGEIPDFLISRIDHFSTFWLMGPAWMALFPLLLLVPIALASAAIPIWHAMGVQPSEALRD